MHLLSDWVEQDIDKLHKNFHKTELGNSIKKSVSQRNITKDSLMLEYHEKDLLKE